MGEMTRMEELIQYETEAILTRWGNSQGIRIPKNVSEMLGIEINEKIELIVKENSIVIKKAKTYKNLKERLEAFYNKPIDEIRLESEEVDWGGPEGDEIW